MFIYDRWKLATDTGRGLLGLTGTLGPFLLVEAILPVVAYILLGLAALFLVYLIQTAMRYFTQLQITETGLSLNIGGWQRHLEWLDVEKVKFSCYAIRRGTSGAQVMTLKLRGSGTKIVVESSLTGFDKVLEAVAAVCRHQGISVDPTTVHNFETLGVPIQPPDGE